MEEDIKILKEMLNNTKKNRRGFEEIRFEVNSRCYKALENILAELQKKNKIIEEIKEYANWHKEDLTETIADYIYDDRIGNARIIEELIEERKHWKDIFRILNNEKAYIDYKNY